MYVCVCVHVIHSLLFPSRRGRTLALNSECKTDQPDFTDWLSFLQSILMEISPNPEPLSKNTYRTAKKIKKIWWKMITRTTTKKEITKKFHPKYFAILNEVCNQITFIFLIDFYIYNWPLWVTLDITWSDKHKPPVKTDLKAENAVAKLSFLDCLCKHQNISDFRT